MHNAGCPGLAHRDDPEGRHEEGGRRRAQDGKKRKKKKKKTRCGLFQGIIENKNECHLKTLCNKFEITKLKKKKKKENWLPENTTNKEANVQKLLKDFLLPPIPDNLFSYLSIQVIFSLTFHATVIEGRWFHFKFYLSNIFESLFSTNFTMLIRLFRHLK